MRRLASTLVLASLLSGIAAPATATPTQVRAHAPTRDKVVEDVRLGHAPIRVNPSTRVRLRFHGEKGELVNLARWSVSDIVLSTPRGARTLRRHGKVVAPFADGYWRLPADGSYAVGWRPTDRTANAFGEVALQLRTVVRKDLTVDGPSVGFPHRTDKTYVARVRLEHERIRLRSTGDLDHVSRGIGLTIEPIGGHELFLDPGAVIHSDDSRSWNDGTRATAGTYLVTVAAGSRVLLSTPRTTPVTLDGPATGPHSAALHEQLFTFEGVAGQVVFRTTTDTNQWDDELTGPDGTRVPPLGLAPGWELPTTGTYTLSARAVDRAGEPTPFTLRLRTATAGPPITAYGSAARFEPTEPGRWVVSPLQIPAMGSYSWRLEATNAPADTTWRAAATALTGLPCPFESTANSCGEQIGTTVTSANPSQPFGLQPQAGSTMLVVYDPGVGGSTAPVDLAVKAS